MHEASTGDIVPYTYSNGTRGKGTRELNYSGNKIREGSDSRNKLIEGLKRKNKLGNRFKRGQIMRKVEKIMLKDIVPMPEVERQYYNPIDYQNLKGLIEKDGYDESYPIRVLWNEDIGKYEAFDGIHRLKIEKELELRSSIPTIDETSFLTRSMAVAKGIKANQFRSPYNPIDIARHLKALGEELVKAQVRKPSVGRPKNIDETEIASVMVMSQSKVSQLLQLLKLPEDTQKLIGRGALKFSHARGLTKLLGTPYEKQIPKLAVRVVEEDIPARQLERIVEAIKHKGYYGEETICRGCKRSFPNDSISKPPLCPDCIGKLRSGELEKSHVESHKEARRKYLKFRAFLERHFSNDSIPENFRNALDRFYSNWKGNSEPIMGMDDA